MAKAILIINQPGVGIRQVDFAGEVVSIGRADDNTISIVGDSNVSRYHTIIEARNNGYWVNDLNSSNGTSLNDKPIEIECMLHDGDIINVGGTTKIEFQLVEEEKSAGANESAATSDAVASGMAAPDVAPASGASSSVAAPAAAGVAAPPIAAPAAPAASGSSSGLIIMGIVGGIALVAVAVFLLIYFLGGSCSASARFRDPQGSRSVREPIKIQVSLEGDDACIQRIIYQLDGEEFARSSNPPYSVTLDPSRVKVSSSDTHTLTMLVEDESGNRKPQEDTVMLDFKPLTADAGNSDGGQQTSGNNSGSNSSGQDDGADSGATVNVSVGEVQDMCKALSKNISSKADYNFDLDFLQQVQERASSYVAEGYYERALKYRGTINQQFIGELGLPPLLGYGLAMSRSRFELTKGPSAPDGGEGLWKVPSAVAKDYITPCGTGTLSDDDQVCSAKVASAYLKVLAIDLFFDDFIYAVACFGIPTKDAGQFKTQLPENRRDFWKLLKSTEQRDRVVRFFAAGIVGENPQKFGLEKDRALSELYPRKR